MTPNDDLQLERAEFDKPEEQSRCAMCSAAFERRYFQINGQSVCTMCCGKVRATLEGSSRRKRGVKALGAGMAAALAGSILYYGILALSGYEFALIAIVVGLMVGKAVSWGAEGRGGWLYQSTAVVLTYLSIVSAYVPLIIAEVRKVDAVEASQTAPEAAEPAAPAAPAAPVVQASAQTTLPGEADGSSAPPSLGGALFGLALLVAFVLAMPFLGGLENILGLVIIGIGLYEAWKLNRRREVVITGPHAIGPMVPAAAPAQ